MDDQTYQIALSPDLHISSEEFANAWNEDDIARTFAEAHLSQAKGTQFFDPMLVTVLLTVGTGVATNLLSDLIEGVIQRLTRQKEHPEWPGHTNPQTYTHRTHQKARRLRNASRRHRRILINRNRKCRLIMHRQIVHPSTGYYR